MRSTRTSTAPWSANNTRTARAEILRRVRQVVGAQPPLVASLDLAENLPPADILECGPEVVACDPDPGAAGAEAVACALWQLPFGFVALQQSLR